MEHERGDHDDCINRVDKFFEVVEAIAEELEHDLNDEEEEQDVVGHVEHIPPERVLGPNQILQGQLSEDDHHQHDGHVATNNLIRVVVDDLALRGYVYQFLKSEIGQSLMLKSAYGTNQEHLEPDVIGEIPVPVPKDPKLVKKIGNQVIKSIEELEASLKDNSESLKSLLDLLG